MLVQIIIKQISDLVFYLLRQIETCQCTTWTRCVQSLVPEGTQLQLYKFSYPPHLSYPSTLPTPPPSPPSRLLFRGDDELHDCDGDITEQRWTRNSSQLEMKL